MKLFEQEHKYQYDWDTVTSAFWLKYPNSVQKHIKNIDIIGRSIDTNEKTLKLKRIIHLQYYIPNIFKNLFNIDGKGLALEEIIINLREKKLTVNTVNYTLNPLINISEECVYFQKDNDVNQTYYKQVTTLNIKGLGYMKNLVENTIINTIKEKSKQGINIMNDTIKKTINDSIHINNSEIYIEKLEKNKK
ncbi:MSF1-like protein, putative [Plasmodium malariae]|uniref:MSF1-like protein, putative n=1 Tax=Plasmodium malariae TaxID=5858 RepID=A0A1C3L0W3_PLAMA|nr:MSF1-like protein, putative [Plasmodium malariae]